jgi:hypothetical protein
VPSAGRWLPGAAHANAVKENPMKTRPTLQIELTPEQKEAIRKRTGKELPAVKLDLEALETRLAPGIWGN